LYHSYTLVLFQVFLVDGVILRHQYQSDKKLDDTENKSRSRIYVSSEGTKAH
jgi:hypothetical protein